MLEYVAVCGFDGVEFAGYYDMTAEEIKGHLDRLGLACSSTHTPAAEVFEKPEEVIACHKTLGCDYVIVPWYDLKTREQVLELAEKFNRVQKLYADNGITLGYHNHSHELVKDGAQYLLEILLEKAPAVQLEVDTYWVYNAGVDVREFLLKHKDRIRMIHLKDGNQEGLQAVGEGDVDIQTVLNTAKEIGLEWAVVENDEPKPNGFDDVTRSMQNLKSQYTY